MKNGEKLWKLKRDLIGFWIEKERLGGDIMNRVEAINFVRKSIGVSIAGKEPYLSHKEILQIALFISKQQKEIDSLKIALKDCEISRGDEQSESE